MEEEKQKSPAYLQRENHAESFKCHSKEELEEKRKFFIDLIAKAQEIPPGDVEIDMEPFEFLSPDRKMKKDELLEELWINRRYVEACLKLC